MKFKKLTDEQLKALAKMLAIFALAYFLCGVCVADNIRQPVTSSYTGNKSQVLYNR